MAVLLALAFGAQCAAPWLLAGFERDVRAIGQGQVYRLFTALWFQDGGLGGAIFNLATLLVVGSLAEMMWRRRDWLFIYFGTGLAIELLALWWQPAGAGNSIANFGLVGALLMPPARRDRQIVLLLVQIVGLGAGVALALSHDIHGAALLLGAGLGRILSRSRPPINSAVEV